MATAAASRRPAPAFTVSAFARDDPLVRDLYDDDEIETVATSRQVRVLQRRVYGAPPFAK